MDKERNWIYDSSVCMPDVQCGSYPLPNSTGYDYVSFTVVLSDKDEYYIEVGIVDNLDPYSGRESFYLSMERPSYIQKPRRNLTKEEKIAITTTAMKRWYEIIGTLYIQCTVDCAMHEENGRGCDKFCNRSIPVIPPDYTLLPDF